VDRVLFRRVPQPGDRAPDARGRDARGRPLRLFDVFRGPHFTVLLFTGGADHHRWAIDTARRVRGFAAVDVRVCVVVPGAQVPPGLERDTVLLDPDREAHRLYGAGTGSLHLVRPDGYVGFRHPGHRRAAAGGVPREGAQWQADAVLAHLARTLGVTRQPVGSP
jgi:hypothetical protein